MKKSIKIGASFRDKVQGRTFVEAMEKLVFGRKCGEQVALATPGAVPVV